MPHPRRFRFGAINETTGPRDEWIAHVRRVEAYGYSTFLIRDHFVPDYFGDQFAPFAALTTAAHVTSSLRVGTLVIDNDYRHPVVLAKEAATLDLLSDGAVRVTCEKISYGIGSEPVDAFPFLGARAAWFLNRRGAGNAPILSKA